MHVCVDCEQQYSDDLHKLGTLGKRLAIRERLQYRLSYNCVLSYL